MRDGQPMPPSFAILPDWEYQRHVNYVAMWCLFQKSILHSADIRQLKNTAYAWGHSRSFQKSLPPLSHAAGFLQDTSPVCISDNFEQPAQLSFKMLKYRHNLGTCGFLLFRVIQSKHKSEIGKLCITWGWNLPNVAGHISSTTWTTADAWKEPILGISLA